MPRIIQETTSLGQTAIGFMDGMQQSTAVLAPFLDRLERQNTERDRMARDDRDFEFRERQAALQQGNNDRALDQRDLIFEQRDAQLRTEQASEQANRSYLADVYKTENPGPAGFERWEQIDQMDARSIQGAIDAERYSKKLDSSMRDAQATVTSVIEDYGLMATNPQLAERLIAMAGDAGTVEEAIAVRDMAWEIAQQTEQNRKEVVNREQTVAGNIELLAKVPLSAIHFSRMQVLHKQYLSGQMTTGQYYTAFGKTLDEAQGGGGGERPTPEQSAYSKGVERIASLVASREITEEQGNEQLAKLRRMLGPPGGGGGQGGQAAFQQVPAAQAVDPEQLRTASLLVAKTSDPDRQDRIATEQAIKIHRENGGSVEDKEGVAGVAAQILGQVRRDKPSKP